MNRRTNAEQYAPIGADDSVRPYKTHPHPADGGAFWLIKAAKCLSSQNMEMDVVHSLTGELADVCDHAVAVREALLAREPGDDGIDTVSYTHLDVYKRQV